MTLFSKADRIVQRVSARRRQAIQHLRLESPMLDQELTRRERLHIERKTIGPVTPPPAAPGPMQTLWRSLER